MNIGFQVSGHQTPARVQALATRNLQLLQAIESTLSQLGSDVKLILAIAGAFEEIQQDLVAQANGTPLDPEGAICNALTQASSACARIHAGATARHKAACLDQRLRADDGVVDAYREYIAALESVHEGIEALKDWIATHDAILVPDEPGVFTSVDDLFAAMGVNAR